MSETNKLIIPKNWSFRTKSVANNFDSHVREQLPWYDLLTSAVAHIGRHYIPEGGLVYDIGASTGNIANALHETIASRDAEFIAIENSQSMIDLYQAGKEKTGMLVMADACKYEYKPFDFAVCFLSLMFIEPERRAALLQNLRSKIKAGGAIVVVEKTEPKGGYPSVVMSRLALAEKLRCGATAEEIIKKELSLSGVQRPLKSELMADAVEFFRFGDFAGWIIEGDK